MKKQSLNVQTDSQVKTYAIISKYLPEKKTENANYEFSTDEILEKLNLLINLSCQSASLKPLKVAQKNGLFRKERSQINLFIQTPFGEFKSTIFRLAAEHYPSVILTDVTFPKLVGSYDIKSKRIVPSACWEHRKETVILDEI